VSLAVTERLELFVPGKPEPAGSKRAFVKGGRAIVVDDNARAKPWQAAVRSAAAELMAGREILSGPLMLSVWFTLARPKVHYRANGIEVKPSAPAYPTVRPDTTKLLRGLEDALTGVLWRDDAQVVYQTAWRLYSDDGAAHTLVIVEILNERKGET
jgi:Holliday junction resolvase RusA-like endonuclease